MDAIRELKTRAEILHRRIQNNDRRAIGRLRVLPQFRRASYERLAAAASGDEVRRGSERRDRAVSPGQNALSGGQASGPRRDSIVSNNRVRRANQID